MLTAEAISGIERTFLSPYYATLTKQEKETCTTPLLEDFDAEISIYVVSTIDLKKRSKLSTNYFKNAFFYLRMQGSK